MCFGRFQPVFVLFFLLTPPLARADFRALSAQSAYIPSETFRFGFSSGVTRRQTDEKLYSFPEFEVSYTVAGRVEVFSSWGVLVLDRAGQKTLGGGGDVLLATKIALFARPKNWAAAFRFAVKLPNAKAQRGLGTDETDIFYGLLLSERTGLWELAQNLGMGILGDPAGGQEDVYTYALSANFRPSRFDFFAQWYGQTNHHPENVFSHLETAVGFRAGKVRLVLSGLKSLTTKPKGYQNTLGADWGAKFSVQVRP